MTFRAWTMLLSLIAAAVPVLPLAAQIGTSKFANHIPGVADPNQTTAQPVASVVAPAPCSPLAIRMAAAQHVAPALRTCTLAAVRPYLDEFFKPAPPVVDVSDPAAVGIIVDQRPDPGAAVGGDGLVVYVGAIVPQPPKPKPQPKIIDPDATAIVAPITGPHGDEDTSILYPWWVWPSAIVLAILVIGSVGWLLFRKREDVIDETVSSATGTLIVRCTMDTDRHIIDTIGPLAERPHLTIAIAFEAGLPRTSDIAIVREEILP